jgi:hypothetical protein
MMGRTATIFADSSRYASHLRVARLGRVAGIEELVLTQQVLFLTVTSEQALRLTGGRR